MPGKSVTQAKQALRERIWELLEREHVTEPGAHGYIPAFTGTEVAADLLARTTAWETARVIKAVPDRAQQPVRERALRDGKLLYMAAPRLAEDPPFYELDPGSLPVPAAAAASREIAVEVGRRVGTSHMRPLDMAVCGSVAVNRDGARLGKGAGYSDLELALLAEARLIGPATVIATTVHPLQVLGDPIPEASHDFSVDLIVTTSEVIRCGPPRRPASLDWDQLPASMIAAIPVLAARQEHSGL